MRCYRKAMRIRHTEHVTNDAVLKMVGQRRKLLANWLTSAILYTTPLSKRNVRSCARHQVPRWTAAAVVGRPYTMDRLDDQSS